MLQSGVRGAGLAKQKKSAWRRCICEDKDFMHGELEKTGADEDIAPGLPDHETYVEYGAGRDLSTSSNMPTFVGDSSITWHMILAWSD